MPGMSFADLVEAKRTFKVVFANGGSIEVTYRPDKLTPASIKRINDSIEDGLSAADLLLEVMTDWELYGPIAEGTDQYVPAGEKIPLDVAHLEHIPGPHLGHILNSIVEDANPDPKAKSRRSTGR